MVIIYHKGFGNNWVLFHGFALGLLFTMGGGQIGCKTMWVAAGPGGRPATPCWRRTAARGTAAGPPSARGLGRSWALAAGKGTDAPRALRWRAGGAVGV